ncbi:hypothetical protein AAZX31_04G141100 [Glycine max]
MLDELKSRVAKMVHHVLFSSHEEIVHHNHVVPYRNQLIHQDGIFHLRSKYEIGKDSYKMLEDEAEGEDKDEGTSVKKRFFVMTLTRMKMSRYS